MRSSRLLGASPSLVCLSRICFVFHLVLKGWFDECFIFSWRVKASNILELSKQSIPATRTNCSPRILCLLSMRGMMVQPVPKQA
ncbi:hypothetical protein BJX62DRAFT_163743 [Aspergillus germanicus]